MVWLCARMDGRGQHAVHFRCCCRGRRGDGELVVDGVDLDMTSRKDARRGA